jgi:diguanylate cyclase (GGDEF)-like protein
MFFQKTSKKKASLANVSGYLQLIFILLIIGILPLVIGRNLYSSAALKAIEGKLDLTEQHLENQVYSLEGEWEFYWNQLVSPNELLNEQDKTYIDVPSSWNRHPIKNSHAGNGYATYRLTFKLPNDGDFALKIPRISTAYKLWVNDTLIASAGTVGESIETATPQTFSQVVFFEGHQGENELLIQVANFHHRSGGLVDRIELGSVKQVSRLEFERSAKGFALFGALVCLGVYHFILFFFRREGNSSALYFGLFCLLIGTRILLSGNGYLYVFFPEMNWEIAQKILTLTYYISVPLALMFFQSIFPRYFKNKWINVSKIMSVIFSLSVILTPTRIFTVIRIGYQIWSIWVILYVLFIFMKILIHREKNSWLIGGGMAALLISSMNDILFFTPWINDNSQAFFKSIIVGGNLTPIGLFIFALANSLVIGKRFASALTKEEETSEELIQVNANLDEIVRERTEELLQIREKIEQQNLELERKNEILQQFSFSDYLIGIGNRRKYNLMIDSEWSRCLHEQTSMALLIIDIDDFKGFNDYYGHQEGDKCLIKVGKTLQKNLLREMDMLMRYGGEEFVIIMTEVSQEVAMESALNLKQKIEELSIPHATSKVNRFVTVSIGGSVIIPSVDSSYHELFKKADKALYQVKNSGRNQVRFL